MNGRTKHIYKTNQILKFLKLVILYLTFFVSFSEKSSANTIIMDAEIENTLKLIAKPIINASKIKDSKIQILLINSHEMNAFIVDNNYVFFTTGLIIKLKSLEMFQAVLAHEVAHITSGHVLKTKINLDNIELKSNIGAVLGMLIASTLNASAGMAVSIGTNIVSQSSYLSHSKQMEMTADAIAVKYLNNARINPNSALKAMQLFKDHENLIGFDEDNYISTHPSSAQRMHNIKILIKQLEPKTYSPNKYLKYRYQRLWAKVIAFSNDPQKTLSQIDQSSTNEITLIQRAIASHLEPNASMAIEAAKSLISLKPDDPYYIQLLGQIYLETGQPKKAINTFSKALSILPDESSFLMWKGIAHLAINNDENDIIALEILETANQSNSFNSVLLRHLSIAYARNNKVGKAALKTAEYSFILGQLKSAKMHARKALKILKPHSIEWRNAQDILSISSKIGVNE